MKTNLQRLFTSAAIVSLSVQFIHAHRSWIKPSATILSGEKSWVTFDAATSNDLFYPNHRGMALDSIKVISPTGEEVSKQHLHEGEVRSTFDLELTEEGTYAIMSSTQRYSASWQDGEERKRWRGSIEEFQQQKINENEGVTLTVSDSKKATFITHGEPDVGALKPKNQGLELIFSETHPNDLIAEEPAVFTLLLDGKPTAGVQVEVYQANDRFRDDKSPLVITSDENGRVVINWPSAGSYWLSAEYEMEGGDLAGVPLKKRNSISATLEVFSE
ncbi:MAG: DUF4198 domain-containing protein [Akkermansiaceae bacterium]